MVVRPSVVEVIINTSMIIWFRNVLVSCTSLTDPVNGKSSCSLGDDGVHSYEDTCSFTCNTGYKLTGNDTRICQSDGNWSGSDDVCRRGDKYACL